MRKEMPHHIENNSKAHIECALEKIKDLKATISKLENDIVELEDKHAKILGRDNCITFDVKKYNE